MPMLDPNLGEIEVEIWPERQKGGQPDIARIAPCRI